MSIVRSLVSGSSVFRTTAGKIRMMEAGRLTPARIAKYLVVGNLDLRANTEKYVESHPDIHSKLIIPLQWYLNDLYKLTNCKSVGTEYRPDYADNGDCRDIVETTIIWPVRVEANRALEWLATIVSPALKIKINDILAAAPPMRLVETDSI